MSEVKIFRVTGEINKPNLKTKFQKEIRALKKEDAEIGRAHV
jgi:ribosomal protein L20A (L18A)